MEQQKVKITLHFYCRWKCHHTLLPRPIPPLLSLIVTCLSVWQVEKLPIIARSEEGGGAESVLMTAKAVDLLYLPMFNDTIP